MKKIFTLVFLMGIVVTGAVVLSSCTKKPANMEKDTENHPENQKISHYTCPMHHQIHRDKPGDCPICGMKLVAVPEETQPPGGERSITISPDRQALIGVKTERAVRKPVVREIRTVGQVAFDPELAVAQREFLEIAKNVPNLREAAVSRLRLLGMGTDEIKELEKSGKSSTNLYLPNEKDSVWVYATIYQNDLPLVSPGMEAQIGLAGQDQKMTGTVRAVDPVINRETRSARARIELPDSHGLLKPNAFVDVRLRSDLGEALTVPKSAVVDTGTRKVAFVVKGAEFQAREIKTGVETPDTEGDVVVLEGISEGETVATGATFLIDSESQLKSVISSGMTPTCPEGQAWDLGMSMCMPKPGS